MWSVQVGNVVSPSRKCGGKCSGCLKRNVSKSYGTISQHFKKFVTGTVKNYANMKMVNKVSYLRWSEKFRSNNLPKY